MQASRSAIQTVSKTEMLRDIIATIYELHDQLADYGKRLESYQNLLDLNALPSEQDLEKSFPLIKKLQDQIRAYREERSISGEIGDEQNSAEHELRAISIDINDLIEKHEYVEGPKLAAIQAFMADYENRFGLVKCVPEARVDRFIYHLREFPVVPAVLALSEEQLTQLISDLRNSLSLANGSQNVRVIKGLVKKLEEMKEATDARQRLSTVGTSTPTYDGYLILKTIRDDYSQLKGLGPHSLQPHKLTAYLRGSLLATSSTTKSLINEATKQAFPSLELFKDKGGVRERINCLLEKFTPGWQPSASEKKEAGAKRPGKNK